MTRTAGTTAPNRTIPASSPRAQDSQDQIVAWIWGGIADLWHYGESWAVWHDQAERMNQRTHTLFQQLQDPVLQRSAHFPAAQERCWRWERHYLRWSAHADSIERVAQGVQRTLTRHLKRLSQRRRAELLSHRGWVQSDDPEQIAAGMWQRAKRMEVWPEGEAGFLKPDERELSAARVGMTLDRLWVANGMAWPNPVICPF